MATLTTGDQAVAGPPAADAPPWHRRRALAPILVVGYLACAYPIYHPAIRHPASRISGGNDSLLFSWWLGWIPHAVAHGMNPLLTGHMNAPDQVNGMWNTSVPLLGVLGAPVTAAAGPVVTLNLWLVLSPVLSASALFFVLRRRFGTLPSAVAGLLYGFSPYVIGHSLGHLHLSVALLPVLALPLLEDVFLRQRHPRRSGVLLGLLAAGQVFLSTEVLATATIMVAVAVATLAAARPGEVRARVRPALTSLAVAAVTALVVAGGPLLLALLGPGRPRGPIQQPGVAVADLYAFVVRSPLQVWHSAGTDRIFSHFTSNATEVSTYLGVPLILLTLYLLIRYRRTLLVTVCGVVAPVAAVLSLGSRLHIRGHNTGIRMPWVVFGRLPLINNALPGRLSLYVVLAISVLLAWWLHHVARAGRGRQLAATALVAAALVPLVPLYPLPVQQVRTPRFFTGSAVTALPRESTVLVLPYPWSAEATAMLWQARAGYRFRMPGGYFVGQRWNGLRLFNPVPTPLTAAAVGLQSGYLDLAAAERRLAEERADARRIGVSAIVLGPTSNADRLRALVDALTGQPGRPVGGVVLWQAPADQPLIPTGDVYQRS